MLITPARETAAALPDARDHAAPCTRNQLCEVTAVKRDDEPDDIERYVYDGGGQRCRKIRSAQSRNRTLIDEVRYLPGLEIRSSAEGEILHVITVQAGRNSVRVLHWQTQPPAQITNNQLRYSLTDHLDSSTLELDHQGGLISQESYYPFGGTAWWAAQDATEAKYKTVRYSGKERDATGLYYYGFRYYAPWLQRWINPDPAGHADGLNRYIFVHNRPISLYDDQGAITINFDSAGNKFYQDESLMSRLEAFRHEHAKQLDFIEKNYSHHIWGRNISSERKFRGQEDEFFNEFTPAEWVFNKNYKRITETPDIHADYVAVAQYMQMAKEYKFEGALPSLIIRGTIQNEGVIKVAKGQKIFPKERMEEFFTNTQVGKSTRRFLNTFQLIAIEVQAITSGSTDLDIHIKVQPEALAAADAPTPSDRVPPLEIAGSRFSVTPVSPQQQTSRLRVTPVNPDTSRSRFSVTPALLELKSPPSPRRKND
jgi:insecticidal toxin complex protein TccC